MDIDLSLLRALEREKEISFDILIDALEQALLTAYHKTPGAQPKARVQLDRKTGRVTVLAAEVDEEGEVLRGVRRHPRGLRPDRRDHRQAGDPAAAARRRGRREVRGVLRPRGRHRLRASSSRAATRRTCSSTSAGSRRCCRSPSGCPGSATSTAPGSSAWWSACAAACAARRSTCPAATRTWSRSSSRSRCPRSPTAPSRSARSPARPVTAPRSRCARRSPASTPRAPASARWGSGCATSCTSCTARRSTSSTGPTTPPSWSRTRCRRRG